MLLLWLLLLLLWLVVAVARDCCCSCWRGWFVADFLCTMLSSLLSVARSRRSK